MVMEDATMTDPIYVQLARALDRLPNGYPRTESGVELRILEKIFSIPEAALACKLSGDFEPLDVIAGRAGVPTSEIKRPLGALAQRGIAWCYPAEGKLYFRLAPFVVGIYEAQVDTIDHELSHLVEHYMREGGAKGIMHPQPALHRVVPARGTVKSEWILPYDDVRAMLLEAKSFHAGNCICRVQQEHVGRKCDFPLDVCLSFSNREPTHADPGDLTQTEALALLDRVEALGLVHTVSNVMEGFNYVCNCCGCCCAILRGINEWGIQDSVAYANYYAVIDEDKCLACGTCNERCQVGAISQPGLVSVVDRACCIGCGLCVSGCPNDAASLVLKPADQIVAPPQDFGAWEQARRVNRHMDV
jgi:Na+-translocating ferredoxin:NAD+ oxidoreductase subunit B